MNYTLFLWLLAVLSVVSCVDANAPEADRMFRKEMMQKLQQKVHTRTLRNGMQVMCITAENTNKVSVGALVKVGSKDERVNEFGMAHILEHMTFKGTKTRKEGELDRLVQLFGLKAGDSNACTWYDFTFYFFNTDAANWQVFGDVIADTVQNLEVTDEALTSELGAIAQEIKLSNHDQDSIGFKDALPFNHPYSHSVIGYKEEVFAYTAQEVMAFYEKHYIPQKTTFIVCGNVDPAQVFQYAEQAFERFDRVGNQTPELAADRVPFYGGFSSTIKTIYHPQLYRNYEFYWLGASQEAISDAVILQYIAYALNKRLQQKWVDENGWCMRTGAGTQSFKYTGVFSVQFRPKEEFYGIEYEQLLADEIADITQNGLKPEEFVGAFSAHTQELASFLENPLRLFQELYLHSGVTGDPFSQFCMQELCRQNAHQDAIRQVARQYLRPTLMSKEIRLPLPQEEWREWQRLQDTVAAREQVLLVGRTRVDASMAPPYTDVSALPQPKPLDSAPSVEYNVYVLSNGLTVYWRHESSSQYRAFTLIQKEANTKKFTETVGGKEFALSAWGELLMHGNSQYSKKELDDHCDALGISLFAGQASLGTSSLKSTFEEGLRLLRLCMDTPLLPETILERKKAEHHELVAQAQNELMYRFSAYLNKTIYKEMPGVFSEEEVLHQIDAITMNDVCEQISHMRDPARVVGIMVGDFTAQEVQGLAEKYFGSLESQAPRPSEFIDKTIVTSGHEEVSNEKSLVCALRPTCFEDAHDTPALALLDEYLKTQLFNVRERTGLFYASGAGATRGTPQTLGAMRLVTVCVPDAVNRIKDELRAIVQKIFENGISSEVLQSLKEERVRRRGTYVRTPDSLVCEAVDAIAQSKPFNHKEQFDAAAQAVTFEQMDAVVKKYFDPATWSFITVGRGTGN